MPSGQHTAIGERVYLAASGVVVPRVFGLQLVRRFNTGG